jgi:ketosteroid isomerase-like protein
MTGDPATRTTLEAVRRFNEAFDRHDVDGVMAVMTEDCVFENACPPPDGERSAGQGAVRNLWERFFSSSPDSRFTAEEIFTSGDRCVVRWRYDWRSIDGTPGHIRGVDIFCVHGGKEA